MCEHRARIKSLRGSTHCGEDPAPRPATPKCYHMALAWSYRLFPHQCLVPKVMTFVCHMKICSWEALHSRLYVAEGRGRFKGAALLGSVDYCLGGKSKVKLLSRVQLFATPWSPTRLLCPWDFPGKNTGVGCHFLLPEIFPLQGLNPGLPHCRQRLYCLSYQGTLVERWGGQRTLCL